MDKDVPDGTRARKRVDDRLLQSQLGKGEIRDGKRQIPLLQVSGLRQHEIGIRGGVVDQGGELDDEGDPGKPFLPRLLVRGLEGGIGLGDQEHLQIGDPPGRD
jgi:hypothetical protein